MFCEKKERLETGQLSQQENVQDESILTTIKPQPINYDSMFTVLFEITEKLKTNPDDINLRQELVSAGYDTTWETILAVGFGDPSIKASSESISKKFSQQAAESDGYRWAAYIKKWKDNPQSVEFGKISSTISGGRVVAIKPLADNRMSVLVEVKSADIQ